MAHVDFSQALSSWVIRYTDDHGIPMSMAFPDRASADEYLDENEDHFAELAALGAAAASDLRPDL